MANKNPVDEHYEKKFDGGDKKLTDLDKKEKDSVKDKITPGSGGSAKSDKTFYSPDMKSIPSGRFSLKSLSARKKGALGTSFIAIIILVVYSFSIISGPFQFIHMSHLLQQNFASLELMSERRFNAHLRSWNWGGKGAIVGSRLGTISNRVANGIETKLKNSGIELVVSPVFGTLEGIKIDGKIVAEFDGDPNNFRRAVTNAKVAERMGWSKSTTALATRLPFARYDVSLRILGNVVRGAHDSAEAYAKKVNDARAERIGDTSFDYTASQKRLEDLEAREGDLTTEEKAELEALRADTEGGSSSDRTMRETAEAYDKAAGDHNAKLKAAAAKFESISSTAGKGSIIAMFLALSCLIDSLADASKTEAFLNVYTPMIRMGGEAESLGSQVESGIDVTEDELAVYAENLCDEKTGTCWNDSAGFGGDVPIPAELNLATRIVSTAVNYLNKAEQFLDASGIGLITENPAVCSVVTNPWFGWGLFVVEVGAAILSAGSSAAATGPIQLAGKALVKEIAGDWVAGKTIDAGRSYMMSLIVGKVVPVLAKGALYGSIVSMGSHYGANEAGRSVGGVSLTPEQSGALNDHLRDLRLEESAKRGFAYKYFDTSNPYSLVSSMITSVSNKGVQDVVRNLASFISAPSEIIGSFFSSPVLALENNAQAALEAGAPKIAFTLDELYPDDPVLQDPFLAEEYVKDHNLGEKYDACLKSPVDAYLSGDLDALGDNDFYLSPMPNIEGCDYPDTTQELYDYSVFRVHNFDVINLLSLGCLEGDDISCSELGLPEEGSQSSSSTAVGQVINGTSQELAQQILDNEASGGGISFQMRYGIYDQKVKSLIPATKGELSIVDAEKATAEEKKGTYLSSELLRILLQANADGHDFQIYSITTRNHSKESAHYYGRAVDLPANDSLYKYLYDNSVYSDGNFCIGSLIYEPPPLGTETLNAGQPYVYDKDTRDGHMGHIHLSVNTDEIGGCQ